MSVVPPVDMGICKLAFFVEALCSPSAGVCIKVLAATHTP